MMRTDDHNLNVYPERTETTSTQQISIPHVCSTEDRESKEFLVDETLSQVCSTDGDESKSIIVDEIYTKES